MLVYCCGCGAQLDLTIPEDAQTFRCPVCGEDVCADYEPAYSDGFTTAKAVCYAFIFPEEEHEDDK